MHLSAASLTDCRDNIFWTEEIYNEMQISQWISEGIYKDWII